MNQRKRVALFGGSFDPPTLAHIAVAAQPIQLGLVDEVWIQPCGLRPDKNLVATPEQRLHMMKLTVQDMFHEQFPVKVDDFDVQLGGNFVPTYNMIKKYEEKYPDVEFFFVIGTDLLPTLSSWYASELLMSTVRFIAIPRGGTSFEPLSLENIPLPLHFTDIRRVSQEKNMQLHISNLSSSLIRERLNTVGVLGLYGLVSPSTIQFLMKNKIYQ